MINEELIKEGLAKVIVYEPNKKYLNHYKELEDIAVTKEIGMWSNK
ncbi:endonuclease YncB(thermonuclease family) [Cytobacillus purgationiresistens]|uniref:Endonuclease YncB(Thermonuclease family) n=2 Tax=Cytobacillus purgationiresistens TaxID=863449 RepID=A0ABU0ASS6_9BACI|nr:thermonuclease family protein [Cytobacillus purgationiresistens]MDQ0273483.1 endonuclease YncB(thermonuclease family) [Cytobacillus purgationiresistens]